MAPSLIASTHCRQPIHGARTSYVLTRTSLGLPNSQNDICVCSCCWNHYTLTSLAVPRLWSEGVGVYDTRGLSRNSLGQLHCMIHMLVGWRNGGGGSVGIGLGAGAGFGVLWVGGSENWRVTV